MEQWQVYLFVAALVAVAYFFGRWKGKHLGKIQLFNEICISHEEWKGELRNSAGETYEVSTRYLGQVIVLIPESEEHPFLGSSECQKNW
ncbi:MAG: hypothetical protein WC819_01315 [Parcubacteria group bacterium]|jgi:hypothetical protein